MIIDCGYERLTAPDVMGANKGILLGLEAVNCGCEHYTGMRWLVVSLVVKEELQQGDVPHISVRLPLLSLKEHLVPLTFSRN